MLFVLLLDFAAVFLQILHLHGSKQRRNCVSDLFKQGRRRLHVNGNSQIHYRHGRSIEEDWRNRQLGAARGKRLDYEVGTTCFKILKLFPLILDLVRTVLISATAPKELLVAQIAIEG